MTSDSSALDERLANQLRDQSSRSDGKKVAHFWTRWLHVYVSMFSFLVVLFFGVTGITLNHPAWTFGDESTITTSSGVLPSSVVVNDEIEFLAVSEFLRAEHDVGGSVSNFGAGDGEGTISYKGPGYGADVFFDLEALSYDLTVQQQGFVGVMNDLHKGRDTSTLWRWVIDVSGALLVVVAVSGLTLQFLMRKRRRPALAWAAVGTVAAVVFIWIAMS